MKLPTDEASATIGGRIQMIPRAQLVRWEDNPRKNFAPTELIELKQSIEIHGFLECFPLLVRRTKAELRVIQDDERWFVECRASGELWNELHECLSEEEAAQKLIESYRFEI